MGTTISSLELESQSSLSSPLRSVFQHRCQSKAGYLRMIQLYLGIFPCRSWSFSRLKGFCLTGTILVHAITQIKSLLRRPVSDHQVIACKMFQSCSFLSFEWIYVIFAPCCSMQHWGSSKGVGIFFPHLFPRPFLPSIWQWLGGVSTGNRQASSCHRNLLPFLPLSTSVCGCARIQSSIYHI